MHAVPVLHRSPVPLHSARCTPGHRLAASASRRRRRETRSPWFAIRTPLSGRRVVAVKIASFLLPLAAWCVGQLRAVGLAPHDPRHRRRRLRLPPGGHARCRGRTFKEENAQLAAAGKPPAKGLPGQPDLPARAARGRQGVLPRLHHAAGRSPTSRGCTRASGTAARSSSGASCSACVAAVPLGILCGTFDFFSKLFEPFVDFIRYMPAPMFGALCVAILGIDDRPEDRHHLDRHLLPDGAGGGQHHPAGGRPPCWRPPRRWAPPASRCCPR